MFKPKANNNTGKNNLTTHQNWPKNNRTNLFSFVRTINHFSKPLRFFSDFGKSFEKMSANEQLTKIKTTTEIPQSLQALLKQKCRIETKNPDWHHVRFTEGHSFSQMSLEEFCEKLSIRGINAHVIRDDNEKDNSSKFTLVLKETLAKLKTQLSEFDTTSETETAKEAEVEVGTISRP